MINAQILLDSINTANNSRITTWILEYPRFVHAEFMTHRMFSKNAASSRAIPIEKMIQMVIENPAMPEWWGKNQSGMQANEELDDSAESIHENIYEYTYGRTVARLFKGTDREAARCLWLEARDKAVEYVKKLNQLGLHKQIANRILEPWFNIRIVMTATEIQNFFALRAHRDAQPEIKILAERMLELYNNSEPQKIHPGQWHIPFGDKLDENQLKMLAHDLRDQYSYKTFDNNLSSMDIAKEEIKIKIAIARCARVSYYNFQGKDDYLADIKLCDRLFGSIPRHLSPTEHVAQAINENQFIGNFRGWKQYRKFFDNENLHDERVK
jgi:thymidylate synthase ThyX